MRTTPETARRTRGRRRAAVLGHPVAHSLSPALHRAAYAALGLDWTYDAVDVDVPDLPGFVRGLDDSWVGLSLTMPLKQAVVPLCAQLSPLAGALGVVNTVTFAADRSLVGDNTDVEGIVVALRSAGVGGDGAGATGFGGAEVSGVPAGAAAGADAGNAVVLGGGATAASAVAALGELGYRAPRVMVRSVQRAGTVLAAGAALGLEPRLVRWDDAADLTAEVVVSTVPAGVTDALAERVARAGREGSVLLDVVYAPWPTPLAAAWERAGGTVVSGLEMLLHQAAAQVRLMTGLEPPLEAMRAALPGHD